jgi:hypothetical protein
MKCNIQIITEWFGEKKYVISNFFEYIQEVNKYWKSQPSFTDRQLLEWNLISIFARS